MKISTMKEKQHKGVRKGICLVITVALLLCGCGGAGDETSAEPPVDISADTQDTESEEPNVETQEATITVSEEIEYPFPYGKEDWRLELYTEETAEEKVYRIRVYDEQDTILQDFPCKIEADALEFRFGELYTYADLAVFPENAKTAGSEGLLFLWDHEADRFMQRPITIPWYDQGYGDGTFLVTDQQENTEERTLCCINQGAGQTVELRKWTLTKAGEPETKGKLLIWDCLEKMTLYNGDVEWDENGELTNKEYYEDLFSKRLHCPWDVSAYEGIPTAIVRSDGEDDWNLDTKTYESREALLTDCGFQDAEPYYQYYDRLQNLELELYLDEKAGRGCGFCYSYEYNNDLEKIAQCNGFIFEGIHSAVWEDDTYSVLAGEGEDAGELEGVTQVNYGYTDDGKLSSYEVKGITELVEAAREEGIESPEAALVSMTWVYRGDGTLYCKYYSHDPMTFSTWGQNRYIYYNEMGRPVYRYEYITHGSYESYYIYNGKAKRPKYGLRLDQNGGYLIPEMVVYR